MSGPESHGSHGTKEMLFRGLGLALGLTVIPFLLVEINLFGTETTLFIIAAFAVVQIVVHLIYFLHLDFTHKGGWTILSFVFTLVILVLFVGGSLWIMHHLNTNMMPPEMMMQHMIEQSNR